MTKTQIDQIARLETVALHRIDNFQHSETKVSEMFKFFRQLGRCIRPNLVVKGEARRVRNKVQRCKIRSDVFRKDGKTYVYYLSIA
jgi:hypothetical protein